MIIHTIQTVLTRIWFEVRIERGICGHYPFTKIVTHQV